MIFCVKKALLFTINLEDSSIPRTLLLKLRIFGFNFIKNTIKNYWYVVDNKRVNRFNFRKDVLVSEGFDPNKSEREIMLDRGIYRIYDSGSKLYMYTKNKKL